MKALVFIAHPDDETMFAGGTIALLTRAGVLVRVVCATRGEGGEAGEPPLCTRDALGEVRSAELRCAADALGCAGVAFLSFQDPDVGTDGTLGAYAGGPEAVADALMGQLRADAYDALITHGTNGEYGHPGHVLTHRAGLMAARQAGMQAVFTFGAHFSDHPRPRSSNHDDAADYIVDVSSVFEAKLAAAECHQTQAALFVRRPSQEAGHPVALRHALLRVETFHRVWGADSLAIVQRMKNFSSA
jgi:N-acetylglucosamine malate deacetylase 2